MCDPMTAISVGSMVAGNALQSKANGKVIKQRNARMADETARQDRLREQSSQIFDGTKDQFGRPKQDASLGESQGARVSAVNSAVDGGHSNPATPVTGSAPTVVKGTIARAMTDALKTDRERGAAQAKLQGFGDLSLGNNINLTRSGIDLARLGDFSRGSSSILPMELEHANQAGAGLRQFGQLVSSAGQMAGTAGMMGFNPFEINPVLTNSGPVGKVPVMFPGGI